MFKVKTYNIIFNLNADIRKHYAYSINNLYQFGMGCLELTNCFL